MKLCQNGHSVQDNYVFCPQCGTTASEFEQSSATLYVQTEDRCASCGNPRNVQSERCEVCGDSEGMGVSHSNTPTLHSKPSPISAILTLVLALVQFGLTGFFGMHAGLSLMNYLAASQWDYRFELLKFWQPFTYIDPVASLSAWRLRAEVVLMLVVLSFIWMAIFGRSRNVRNGGWIVVLVFGAVSALVSVAALIQSQVLSYSPREIFGLSRIAASDGGITAPAIIWCVLSFVIVGLAVGGLVQNRGKR